MRMVRRDRRQAAIGLGLILSLLGAAGCGGSDKTSSSAGDTASGESTGRTAAQATPGDSSVNPTGGSGVRTSTARVVLLGTSLTAGLGLDPEKAYPALLQAKADSAGFPVRIINAGLSGETSAGALRRANWVLDQPAAAVILEVGANDGLRGVDPDSTKANLLALIGAVRKTQPGARVLLVQMEAPTNLGRTYTTRFHQVYAEVAREASIPLLPFLLDGVAGVARLNQSDGIHPNAEGSKLVASTMWQALLPTLAELGR
jgi:acyl-CoA thioesterase-1